jgi:hypothetical protein
MTWTGDPVWLADVLRAEGLRVIEHEGWRERGHGDFRDIRGVLCHHTAGGGENDWRVVQYGRADLKGPLSQLVLERDGTYRVIAVGVCWHAGRGRWPGWPTDNANYHVIGIEAVSRGTPDARGRFDWTPVQLDAYKRGCAAILRRLGRDAADCVGHREYSSEGKIDPAGIDMDAFRRDVQAVIDRKPNRTGGSGMSVWDETTTNKQGDTVSRGLIQTAIDDHVGLVLDQLGGPGTRRGGAEAWQGWEQLGGLSLVDALAVIGAALGIEGFRDPRNAKGGKKG